MTTFAEMKTLISRDLRDTDNKVFDTDTVGDLINAALAEVGRISPQRFQEDITPVADTLSYVLRSDEFAGAEVPELELTRVEIWDGSTTPHRALKRVQPLSAEYVNYSQAGWVVWGGRLELTNATEDYINVDDHLIRVWGYSPYPKLVDDADVLPVSTEIEEAMRTYCNVEALRKLISSRVLFTQWQTRTNNSDVSPAALMNDLNIALEEWRRKSRAMFVLRQAP